MFGVPASNLYGSVVVQRPLERHGADHVAAALVRRHRLEQRRRAVEHADAGRAEHLVSRERVEVAAERLHVDRHVRDRLRAVDEHRDPARVREPDDRLDRIDRAERVRDVRRRRRSACDPSAGVSNASRLQLAASVIGMTRSRAPFSSQSICHGTMFEWCSIAEMTTSSPGPTCARP